jgi:transposase InsO family protein
VISESLLVKHQLLIVNRSRVRAPVLRSTDRVIVGLCAILMRPTRLLRSAIVPKPPTILSFHRALVKRKYRLLFTPKTRGKPGPTGPSPELVSAILEMKRRNPKFGYQRIADQISLIFDVEIDKDVVRRVLARHYRPEPGSNGPSWLTFLGHSKDSLWSVDLFRCESLILKSHWVMVVMDQFTRRIIGFAVHAGALDGPAVCRMFNSIIGGSKSPRYLSSERAACPRGTMTRYSDSANGTPTSGFSR